LGCGAVVVRMVMMVIMMAVSFDKGEHHLPLVVVIIVGHAKESPLREMMIVNTN